MTPAAAAALVNPAMCVIHAMSTILHVIPPGSRSVATELAGGGIEAGGSHE